MTRVTSAVRAVLAALGRWRRTVMRAHLALGALQVAGWLGLIAISLISAAALRRRLTSKVDSRDATSAA